MTVSLCMIVRNEEALLARAVCSVAGLADEVVIVDTGSEDGTVALAQSLGVVVANGADRMHKGQARNQSLDMATGDWCFVLDADETLTDPLGLRAFLETTDAQAVTLREAMIDANGNTTLTHSRTRAWRRGTQRFRYRAHEAPYPVNGTGRVAATEFLIEHRPPPERQSWKPGYFLDRLLLDVAENPGDPRPLFYLGRQYTYASEWQKGAETLEQYLRAPGWDQADALGFLARCYGGLGRQIEQIEALHRAATVQPHRRDWWGELAEVYHAKGDHRAAVGLLRCALECMPGARGYVSARWHGAHIYDLLARCLWHLGRMDEGREYARKAAELAPADERLRSNLCHFDDNRFKQLFNCLPELHGPALDILYVGAHRMRDPECVEMLWRAGHRITLLEVWPENADHYRLDPRFVKVVQGDVRTAELPACDVAFFWHGPEHIAAADWSGVRARLEGAARRLVVLGTPWGFYEQGSMYGNAQEEHVARFYPADFRTAGYWTVTQGEPDQVGSHILAWRRL